MFSTIQPTDIALFLVSAAACAYCFVLSRRLKALQDTRDGLGATIMAMTKSVSAVSSATSETRSQTNEIASRLTNLIAEAEAASTRAQGLTEKMEASHAAASGSISAAQAELNGTLTNLLRETEASTRELKFILRQVKDYRQMAAVKPADPDALFDGEARPDLKKAS
ncbi:CAMP factor family pore-forming toxin [Henriciella litoralis]|uniref:CAMP factor family pore-forming toxin n=1 Tax=Henriciella litoralis TaxID=568102 RepID=UPI0009FEC3CD|nr:CAMP factor family pore-forming toxin [Henriciella litoralis]